MSTHILEPLCAALIFATASLGADPDRAVRLQIDRTHKGDRLPFAEVIRLPELDQLAAHAHELPEGCDALVSPLTRSDLARIAGSCVS
jgi:hypothetical protein